mmetsp:Transcript_72868/g.165300  ORF Transcript_72868/g.165300 Transcript_72868/m.165300 type:complete len:90 (+) Transcript_72868:105-374(+)
MPGTLTVRTVMSVTEEIRQEVTLDFKPKGASAGVTGNPHDVGAQAFFIQGGAKKDASMSVKAESALRALGTPAGAPILTGISQGVPKLN